MDGTRNIIIIVSPDSFGVEESDFEGARAIPIPHGGELSRGLRGFQFEFKFRLQYVIGDDRGFLIPGP